MARIRHKKDRCHGVSLWPEHLVSPLYVHSWPPGKRTEHIAGLPHKSSCSGPNKPLKYNAQFHLLRNFGHNGREVSKIYPDSKSHSQKLYDRALSSLPGGNTRTTVFMNPYPIYAARGEGCRVWDVDGSEFIDCINNFTSLIHGHAHPILVEAATQHSGCPPNPRSNWRNCWRRDCRRSTNCVSPTLAPRP
jgi:hypothetical protein